MKHTDLYRLWAAEHLNVDERSVIAVRFSCAVGTGSTDLRAPDFSTFAGCEVWTAHVELADGPARTVRMFDQNPVRALRFYADARSIDLEFDGIAHAGGRDKQRR